MKIELGGKTFPQPLSWQLESHGNISRGVGSGGGDSGGKGQLPLPLRNREVLKKQAQVLRRLIKGGVPVGFNPHSKRGKWVESRGERDAGYARVGGTGRHFSTELNHFLWLVWGRRLFFKTKNS